jgi:hypothetical protein
MFVLTNIGIGEEPLRDRYNWKFYTTFGTLSILLMMLWYYLMGLSFYSKVQQRGFAFKINGLIPVIFYLLLFGRSIYEFIWFLSRRELILATVEKGTMRPVDLGWITTLFNILMLHSILSLFINNNLIRKDIGKLSEPERRQDFTLLYLYPMRTVANTFLVFYYLL